MTKQLWIAELDTRHFEFRCLAETEAKAIAGVRKGWRIHRAYFAPDNHHMYTWGDLSEDVSTMKMELGVPYSEGPGDWGALTEVADD